MRWKGKLFCDINPTTYAISMHKEILKRHIKNLLSKDKLAKTFTDDKLPVVVSQYSCNLIKRAPGIDLTLQENKAVNIDIACKKINGIIIHPGEVFSFWHNIGKVTERKGYKPGRVIIKNKIMPGLGGGLCNLSNTIHRLVLHSPFEVTEFHQHSDALGPDEGKRVPFNAGTSVSYNYIDYRFKNNTDKDIQLLAWCADEKLYAELRCEKEFPWTYDIWEEDHHFKKEGEKYYRNSKIYKRTFDRATGELVAKDLVLDNHSVVMFDHSLIPPEQIRE